MQKPILIVGPPRSGTTWVGQILKTAEKTEYIFEPDNEKISLFGAGFKSDLHRYPYLIDVNDSRDYYRQWHKIFSGPKLLWDVNKLVSKLLLKPTLQELEIGQKTNFVYIDQSMNSVGKFKDHNQVRLSKLFLTIADKLITVKSPSKNRRIIKSVHCILSLSNLAKEFDISPLLVLRNPFALLASYKRMDMPDGYRNIMSQLSVSNSFNFENQIYQSEVHSLDDNIIFQILMMMKLSERLVANVPGLIVISHDRLCVHPKDEFKNLFHQLGLQWTAKVERAISLSNTKGDGFKPSRIIAIQPTKWKQELDDHYVRRINYFIEKLNLEGFLNKYVL